jgi:hypothetical protein
MAGDLAAHSTGTPAVPASGPAPHPYDRNPHDIAAEIDMTGSACLRALTGPQWTARAKSYARALAERGEHEVMIEGPEADDLDFIRELTADPRLRELLDGVTRAGYPDADPEGGAFSCSLRVIQGADPLQRPLWFHYDASVVTMVIPVDIPDADPGQCGELVLYPNHRPYRRWALTNIIEKAVVQSDVYRRRFLAGMPRDRDTEVVSLTPGNAYLFWGYRSYHATLPVAAGHTRITVVLHYTNVHNRSRALRHAKALRGRLRAM